MYRILANFNIANFRNAFMVTRSYHRVHDFGEVIGYTMQGMSTDEIKTLIARLMGPICGRRDPGGPHVGPINFAIWEVRY